MTDYTPIVAFCESRIQSLDRQIKSNEAISILAQARKDELQCIVTLCSGLNNQERLIEEAIGLRCHVSEVPS